MKINPLLFLSVFIVVYSLLNLTLWLIKRYRHKRRIYTLIINGARVKALYDSGNTLINPYNQNGVIIIEKGYLNFDEDEGFMLIPYTALNHNAFIKGYRTTNIFCVEKNLKIKDVTIGISDDALSKSGEYAALIGPAIFKE